MEGRLGATGCRWGQTGGRVGGKRKRKLMIKEGMKNEILKGRKQSMIAGKKKIVKRKAIGSAYLWWVWKKKGRGKEGEVVESGRKVTNFVLPSGYLLLLPKSSGVGWISNTESGTEQRFVWYSPFLQAKKKTTTQLCFVILWNSLSHSSQQILTVCWRF